MKQYLNVLADVLANGEARGDRTGVGTFSKFGVSMTFDLTEGFPAVTTKKLAFKSMTGELLWFLNGETDLDSLRYRTHGDADSTKRTIWDANQQDYVNRHIDMFGRDIVGDDCGKIYGYQWNREDQLYNVISNIITNPESRRHIVSAWNYPEVDNNMVVALPPCHYGFQFYVREGKYLDLIWLQRSADMFLGIPFNISSYALLTHIVAAMTGLVAGRVSCSIGDAHVYKNHVDQVNEQCSRVPYDLPDIQLPSVLKEPCGVSVEERLRSLDSKYRAIKNLTADDFALVGYQYHPSIKAPMAV